jgi:5'-nucleotidase (lipoprotein e(P4) family)
MKSVKVFILSIIILATFSCATNSANPIKPASVNSHEYQIGAYLWFQTSGEYSALCYQAYNLARMRLDRDLQNKHNKPRALVFDIDETVLDNSAGGALDIKNNVPWNKENLIKWMKQRAAIAVPGAREFIEYAVSKNVEIIYLSNREDELKEDSFENLKAVGFPVKKENLYFLTADKSKEPRRLAILKKYEVVLFFGDNLADFHQDWDNKTSVERRALVDSHKDDFGEKFIVLPNPLYGDWENSLPRNKKRTDLLKTEL